jgi:dihydroorotase
LKDGTIDAIVSAHQPQDEENKKLEFDFAADGMNNMQVLLPMLKMVSEDIPMALLIEKLTSGPRAILGIDNPVIDKGSLANITLFHPSQKWIYDAGTNQSKAANSPLFGLEVTGKVLAVFNNGFAQEI